MGYEEAKKDGIKIVSGRKYTIFFPKCHICGEEVKSMQYKSSMQYTCQRCKLMNYMADKIERIEDNKEKKERKLNNAINKIEKQVGSKIKEYDNAIGTIKKNLHKDKWFDSTEEIMTALELTRRKIKIIHQVPFGIYRADFVLPEEKIVLEIDGTVFHTEKTKEKEDIRDSLIILNLGPEWEVVRITDELVNQNIRRLLPAIKAIKKKRQSIRKQYDGMLPDWYSTRN